MFALSLSFRPIDNRINRMTFQIHIYFEFNKLHKFGSNTFRIQLRGRTGYETYPPTTSSLKITTRRPGLLERRNVYLILTNPCLSTSLDKKFAALTTDNSHPAFAIATGPLSAATFPLLVVRSPNGGLDKASGLQRA